MSGEKQPTETKTNEQDRDAAEQSSSALRNDRSATLLHLNEPEHDVSEQSSSALRNNRSATLLRFNQQERALHSVVMLLFLVLLTTGICLHFDIFREALGAWRFQIRTVHHYTGLLLIIVPWYLVWTWRRELSAFFSEMTHWRRIDAAYLRRETKKAHKFNGGQKLNFLLAMIWMLGLAVTGFFVWQSQWISSDLREFLYAWHQLLFYFLTIQIIGHVFYAAIYKPTRHALQGMLHGRVERDWAQEHHPLWVDEVEKEQNEHKS